MPPASGQVWFFLITFTVRTRIRAEHISYKFSILYPLNMRYKLPGPTWLPIAGDSIKNSAPLLYHSLTDTLRPSTTGNSTMPPKALLTEKSYWLLRKVGGYCLSIPAMTAGSAILVSHWTICSRTHAPPSLPAARIGRKCELWDWEVERSKRQKRYAWCPLEGDILV